MSPATLAIALLVAFVLVAVVLNHCYARLALVELTLNEGLPPGHERRDFLAASPAAATDIAEIVEPGVHVFMSRNCHACQRLIDEIDQTPLALDAPLFLHYVDRARPVARQAADRHHATLSEHDQELAAQVGADPLPFTVAVGARGLIRRAVTPTVEQMLTASRDAGIAADRQVPA